MPLKNWFRPGGGSPADRLKQALARSRSGDADGALGLIQGGYREALDALKPMREAGVDTGWLQLAARLAYRAGQMRLAARTAEEALAGADHAATWHLLGRARVWLKDPGAEEAFRRAAALQPEDFILPHRVSRDHFGELADAAFALIPQEFQPLLSNTMVVVDDLPALESVRQGEDPDLLGIYEGATVLERGLPERIVLYQRNHENVSADESELAEQVEETMLHEVGHHFGMEEDDLPY
jgi:predicted Zn-dependent protease with MMP-like domain